MAGAHDASIALVEYEALEKAGRQIVEKSSRKIDRTGAESRPWIVQRNRQYTRRCTGRVLLQEFQQRRQKDHLPDIVHEETEDTRGRERIEPIT